MKLLIVLILAIAFAGTVISEDVTDEVFEEEQYDEEDFDDRDKRSGSSSSSSRLRLCSKPRHPRNGHVKITGLTIGKKAIYSCKSGYILVGSKTRKCLSNRKWSGRSTFCRVKKVLCPKLRHPQNGRVKLTGLRPGKTARYSCNNGFILVGSTIRKCLSNGKWSGRSTFCRAKRILCPKLRQPQNGQVKINGLTPGKIAKYSCNNGFTLVGSTVRKCLSSGKWSGRSTICKAKRVLCPKLRDPNNGDVKLTGLHPGKTARYSCNNGFILVGSTIRKCLSNGKWSGRAPFCKVKQVFCPDLDDPQNGDVDVDGPQRPGQIARYSCDGGFTLIGSKTRRCSSNGVWSGRAPICRSIDCGNPESPDPNGSLQVSSTTVGSVAVYLCNDGFTVQGEDQAICQDNGQWSTGAPICQPIDCGNPESPDPNGSLQVSSTTVGSVAVYQCNDGFTLQGEDQAICQDNGQWSTGAPTCQPVDCNLLPAPVNGNVFFNPGTTFGSLAIFSCENKYVLVGSDTRKCGANGEWSGEQPICRSVKCPKLNNPTNGRIYASGYHPGDNAVFDCTYGYILIGQRKIVCLDTGYWSADVPVCGKDIIH